jgi:two-component system response regulator YesN
MDIYRMQIDILITDIEMPEEDGLSLFKWAKENMEDLECIFLTSHADFEYARKAIQLGGFDYILQPTKFEDVISAVKRAQDKIIQDRKLKRLEKMSGVLHSQQSTIIDSAVHKLLRGNQSEAIAEFRNLNSFQLSDSKKEILYLVDVDIIRWKQNEEEWNQELLRLVLSNVIEELFKKLPSKVYLAKINEVEHIDGFFMVFLGQRDQITQQQIIDTMDEFYEFITQKMDFEIAIYMGSGLSNELEKTLQVIYDVRVNNIMRAPIIMEVKEMEIKSANLPKNLGERWSNMLSRGDCQLVEQDIEELLKKLQKEGTLNIELMKKAFNIASGFDKGNPLFTSLTEGFSYEDFLTAYHDYEDFMEGVRYCLGILNNSQYSEEQMKDSVEQALRYIDENIHKNLTRTEVAQLVYLNEDYFSRIFKARTGCSFKDYVTTEKLKYVKRLLVTTNFSVSIVASKAGYDNFSYFSKVFRKMEDMSPQEYRQLHQQK